MQLLEFLLAALLVAVADQAQQPPEATVVLEDSRPVVEVVVVLLKPARSLATVAMAQMAWQLLQPIFNYEIRYCRRPCKSCVEPHPLGWDHSIHASRWHQLGKRNGRALQYRLD